MLVGPFDNYTPVDDEHVEITKHVYRPVSFGQYTPATLRLRVSRSQLVTKDGKIYVDTEDPWLETLGNAERIVIPSVNNDDTVETVIPVRYMERRAGYEKFYGYYVVLDSSGEVVAVKGAGIYERVIPPKLAEHAPMLPVNVVKDFSELDKREFITLARYTPPQLLTAVDRAGRRDIVATHIAERLKRDPLALVDYPEQIVRKYIIDEQDAIVKMAMMENTPMMMKIFINELKTRGYDGDKLAYLIMREKEEEEEDKQLERMREEAIKRTKSQITEFERNFGSIIKTVYGITLPLTVAIPFILVTHASKTSAKSKKTEKSRATEKEKEEATAQ